MIKNYERDMTELDKELQAELDDPFRAARGCVNGIIMGLWIWAAIALVALAAYHSI